MTIEREEQIRQYRLKQPRAELERKSKKSKERASLWTQEEMDAADALAEGWTKFFNSVNHGERK